MKYQDINGKTGITKLKGSSGKTYGDMRLYTDDELLLILQDGITTWEPPAKPLPTEAELLEKAKLNARASIKADFNHALSLPVNVGGVDYVAGFDSAIKLDAAQRLAVKAGALDVTFYDADDNPHVLSFVEAEAIVIAVAIDYQTKLSMRNAGYNEVKVSDNPEGVVTPFPKRPAEFI